jgi:hypothetical protein
MGDLDMDGRTLKRILKKYSVRAWTVFRIEFNGGGLVNTVNLRVPYGVGNFLPY